MGDSGRARPRRRVSRTSTRARVGAARRGAIGDVDRSRAIVRASFDRSAGIDRSIGSIGSTD